MLLLWFTLSLFVRFQFVFDFLLVLFSLVAIYWERTFRLCCFTLSFITSLLGGGGGGRLYSEGSEFFLGGGGDVLGGENKMT